MCAARDKKPGFDSEITDRELKIKLRGEIDHHSAVAVRTAIDDMIKEARPKKLVIDMSAVELMDSSGLGLIMGRYSLVKEIGGEISVLNPNPRIEKIMSLAGIERIIKIEYTTPRSDRVVSPPSDMRKASAVMSVGTSINDRQTSSPEKKPRRTASDNRKRKVEGK